MHDKEKTCQGCPDRKIEPNCHDTCAGYKHRMEKKAKEHEARCAEADYRSYKINRIRETKKAAMHIEK